MFLYQSQTSWRLEFLQIITDMLGISFQPGRIAFDAFQSLLDCSFSAR
jgi:hypothetical protein